ncbi:hypothetical protein ACFXKI_34725 [Streptomyces mirabilis]|uniref:hypothetical protein n=1 Tax=Streptomyces mirabilis TaxID=68239 RepID=UPI0036821560
MEFRFRIRRGPERRGDTPAARAHDTVQPLPSAEPDRGMESSSGADGTGQLALKVAAFALSVSGVLGLVDAGSSPETAIAVTAACALVAQRFGQRPDGPDGPGGLLQLV